MTDTYVINTVFKANDQMTSTVSRLTNKMSLLGKRSESNFKRATLGATRFKTVLGGVLGANLITAGINQLRMGLGAVTTEFLDFDNAITSAASKWNIERGTKAFKELGTVARDVAKVTPKTAGEAGQALDFLAMAGFEYKQALAALPGVTQLSIAAQTDLARSSDIVSDALSSLGLMTKDSTKLTENLNRVNNVFLKTTTTSNTNLEMLFEGMRKVAPVAAGLGAEVEGLSAMLGTLANSGIKAEEGGTALRNMYLRLTGGTVPVEKTLKRINVKVLDPQTKKMRSLIDILEDVKQNTKNLNDAKRQEIYTTLFGNRAVAASTVLMNAGAKTLHEYEKSLYNATGETKRISEAMGKSWTNRIAALKSRLIEIGLKVFDVFEKEIPQAFEKVNKWLDQFDGEQFKQWLIDTKNEVKPLVIGFIDLLKQGSNFVTFAKESGVTLGGVVKAFVAWKAATIALNLALVGTKNSVIGLLATKGLVPLLKTLGFTGTAGLGAAIGVGVGGAMYVGNELLKGQDEATVKLLEAKKINKLNSIDRRSIVERAIAEKHPKDKALQQLEIQRYKDTGVLPEAAQQKFTEMSRGPIFSSTDLPEKSVIEVNIKAPFNIDTQIKQGKNAPTVKANKTKSGNLKGSLGKN